MSHPMRGTSFPINERLPLQQGSKGTSRSMKDNHEYGSTIEQPPVGRRWSTGGPTTASSSQPINASTRNYSVDEFANKSDEHLQNLQNKIMRTGRQRKKLAARSKGGEFQQRRKKRRVYFCCVSSEIDVEKLHDVFDKRPNQQWESRMYEDVLHLFYNPINNMDQQDVWFEGSPDYQEEAYGAHHNVFLQSPSQSDGQHPFSNTETVHPMDTNSNDATTTNNHDTINHDNENSRNDPIAGENIPAVIPMDSQSAAKLWLMGGKEVFIFDFGAIVFWGFHRGEEEELLNEIRFFIVTKGSGGLLSHTEFEEGQDDMAFVTSPDNTAITIANDVITLPDDASAKSRLSVSFAIAQSTVLAIFEARIERKIEDYKYIPETLADRGKIKLTTKQLGGMIGEVYVIRHDVNLHSEILDTPDFFWKEPAAVEEHYRLTMRYLEMDTRTEILNKRLDMLRELLGVLQQQHENGHAMKLEWIVIWLIIVSSVIELVDILVNLSRDK